MPPASGAGVTVDAKHVSTIGYDTGGWSAGQYAANNIYGFR